MSTEGTFRKGAGTLGDRSITALVYGLSIAVCLAVATLVLFPEALRIEGVDVSMLPRLHAVLNGTTALLLATGYALIRSGRREWHRRAMITAFVLSACFLVSYVIYHSQAPDVRFGGEGWVRGAYFATLISHIVLAPVVLPLALFTLIRGLRSEFDRHRRVARWTLPIWLYVAVTGVAVYLMMAPYY